VDPGTVAMELGAKAKRGKLRGKRSEPANQCDVDEEGSNSAGEVKGAFSRLIRRPTKTSTFVPLGALLSSAQVCE